MSRFLNPSKICLLVLIQLYCHEPVPLKSTIPILSFISSHIIRRTPDRGLDEEGPSPPTLKDFETLLSPRESAHPGRTLYDVFISHMWDLYDLVNFTNFLANVSADTEPHGPVPEEGVAKSTTFVCSPTSPIGHFARRCELESVRLQFSDSYQLWENYVHFREPTKTAYILRNPESEYASDYPNAASADLLYPKKPTASPVLVDRLEKRKDTSNTPSSQDDVERAIHFQLSKLQKYGARVPDEMKAHFAQMARQGGSVPSEVHFINFFDAWRSGAYNNAIELLHRYFDYTMEGHNLEHSIKTYHQYALLHLAVLHGDFGCYGEAISALNECIATARENQDARCLQFSLSWLSHLRLAYPEFAQFESSMGGNDIAGSDSDILTFLQQKAVENKDWAMLSSSLLTQAEATIRSGESIAKALEQVYQSSYLNSSHNIKAMIPSQLLLHSTMFIRLGHAPLAELYCNTMYYIHDSSASNADIQNTIFQIAYMKSVLGNYDDALELMRQNNPTPYKTLRLDQSFFAIAAMIQLRRSIHRNELWAAEQYLRQARPLRKSADAGTAFETHVLEIELLFRKGELTEAFDYICDRIEEAKMAESLDLLQKLKLLILKARVFALSGVPEKGFSIVLRAASSAHRAMLLPVMWEALAALCVILLSLGEFAGVREIIDAIMPQVLEGGNRYLVAELYNHLTDAYVGLAGHECEDGSKEREQYISAALLYVERAKEAYTRVEDLNGTLATIAKKATLFSYRGEESLTEEQEELYAHVVGEAEDRLAEMLGRNL